MTHLPALQLSAIGKSFSGVRALDAVDLTVGSAEIHGLAGENGAGKSTLIKILCGAESSDEGSMLLHGEPYRPRSPLDGLRSGIRVVHQELQMLDELSVAENILFEHLPRNRFGVVNRAEQEERARELLARVGLPHLSPRQRVAGLGMAHRQLIEIAKALSGRSRIVIMDEPTATLTPKETQQLLKILAELKAQGVTVIFVTHHLQEIFSICDRVSVLRNGKHVATRDIASTSTDDLVKLMVGRSLAAAASLHSRAPEIDNRPIAMEVRNLRVQASAVSTPKNLSVRYGEVLGIAGLVGSGRTELVRALAGADTAAGGELLRDGKVVKIRRPGDALAHGICLLTEDRKDEGLILDMSIAANMSLAALGKVSHGGFMNKATERAQAQDKVRALGIRCTNVVQLAGKLSGGNQQKVVMAKWLQRDPQVLILDEPTRGVDVGAKAEIHDLLRDFAAQGKAIIAVSSDLRELMEICDRIIVMSKGAIAGEVARTDFDEEKILKMAYSEYLNTQQQETNAEALPA
ncbi:MAG TPA: sugar ABC transporter ATP-binding protein [Polaromonas sp.]|uniref:sugar ABC transporter ATP-binding protein n=1 Tax=Polaromonas sp. TaxID=1869339 RepID=UPI002D3CA88D|nr:sugar ABC transporter ATP-binding protein [Polaromonas sp.]HYW56240.1 sugar ABC transporter ATP-binding protein [Polaromonas sp.]